MAKFSKGDKVESVKTGAKGVVDEVYGDEKYAVLFDGATNPDRVEGFQIKAANGCARNAKFKVGDKVTDGNAVYVITDVDDGIYEWKFVSGKADPSHSEGGEIAWAEGKMRLANSARNAKFRLGDRVEFRGVKGTVKRVVEGRDGMPTSYKIKGDDGEVYTPSEWDVKYVGNTASLASTNAVVQNAINARRARNAGIWSSAKDAEDRSDIFVRAALSRVNGRFESIDNEAGTLRDVIKLLASAEQTPKIKKNTDKLKGILSRVEKASALLKGI